MIQIFNNFIFQFHNEKEYLHTKSKTNYLGNEYVAGKLTHITLNSFFPHNKIEFLPLIDTEFDQCALLQNLHKENYFKQFDFLALDWPLEFTPHLSKLAQSFPTPICLTNKQVFDKGIFEKENNKSPVYFMESMDSKRFVAKYFDNTNTICLGGKSGSLQLQFSQNNNMSQTFLLTNGLLPWLSSQFITTQDLEKNNDEIEVCKNLLRFFLKNHNKKILTVTNFKTVFTLDCVLCKFQTKKELLEFIENNVVELKINKPETLIMSQPDKESCLDYSNINGFVSAKLYESLNEDSKINDWLEQLKKYFTELFLSTEKKYTDWTKMHVTASEKRDFFRFAYRLAMDRHSFFPSTFHMLLSAKSVINSNFAYEMHKQVQEFPTNTLFENTLKQVQLPLDSFFEKTQKVSLKKFATIQSQKPISRKKLQSIHKNKPIKQHEGVPEEKYADNSWVYEDHAYSCSFPSEDIFMEKLAFDCKKNAQEKVKAKEEMHRELMSDFCDGLDLRETIRNWHKDKIIVKEKLSVGKADIGAVVFAFAKAEDDHKFSWQSFWLAEQHDDSHLMFYATPFKNEIIGPGIAKSEFGGFAVIPLDSYIDNPWTHPYILNFAQNSTECLILAGALASPHKNVLFISSHPPSQHIIKILKQSGKNIIYAKLDEFSQTDIRRVRTFHILAEAGVRAYAEKYIRKE